MDIDKEYIDAEDALKRVGGNKGLFVRLLGQFAGGGHITAVEEALGAKDFEKAARDAHTIKGVGANLSLPKLTAAAIELEEKIKSGGDYSGSLDNLKDIYNITLQQIETISQQQ